MKPTLTHLSEALDRAISLGYDCHISMSSYGDKRHYGCSLSQTSLGGGQMRVTGDGEDLEAAVRKCFSNFPENPLDGTGWKNNRLSAPKPEPVVDAEFIEVPRKNDQEEV